MNSTPWLGQAPLKELQGYHSRLKSLSGGEEDETVTATFVASAYSVSGGHVRDNGGPAPGRGATSGPARRDFPRVEHSSGDQE